MREIHLQKKFDFIVPKDVITSLWNMHNYYQANIAVSSIIKNNNEDSIYVNEFQNSKLLKVKNYTDRNIEFFKMRNEWIFINQDVEIVKNFLHKHFNSFFQFRIDILLARKHLGWHDKHLYPRVFIPMHDNVCKFNIKNNLTEEVKSNIYQLGECWMWDVRKWHSVDNTDSPNDRIMACFSIDPDIEFKADIFV